jgi:hypothetical protein
MPNSSGGTPIIPRTVVSGPWYRCRANSQAGRTRHQAAATALFHFIARAIKPEMMAWEICGFLLTVVRSWVHRWQGQPDPQLVAFVLAA